MNRKIKIFGIGAGVLMLLCAFVPMVSSMQIQSHQTPMQPICIHQGQLTQQQIIRQFFTQHQTDINTIETFLAGINLNNPPTQFPPDIQSLITTLAGQLSMSLNAASIQILLVEKVPSVTSSGEPIIEGELSTPPFYGFTRYLKTSTPITIAGQDYVGHCLAINNRITVTLRWILDNIGVGAAIVYLASLVAVFDPCLGVLLGIFLWNHKEDIINSIPNINQGHGIRIWIYDAVYYVSWSANVCYAEAQPGIPWYLPSPWYIVWNIP